MQDVDLEIAELQRRFAEEKTAEAQARDEGRRTRALELRAKVRRGEIPEHIKGCSECLRAALTLDHGLACAEGKRFVNLWG
jgi:hypothetical protein